MTHPTLSVLMPNYNHGRFLAEALEAILNQSHPASEIIIIDDASTDESISIIESYVRKHKPIRLLCNETNHGVLHNINRLLDLASGDYVFYAAADDRILPGLFEKSLALLARYPQAGLCSSLVMLTDKDGKDGGPLWVPKASRTPAYLPPARVLDLLQRQGSWIVGNATIYRRGALSEVAGFPEALHAFCDGFIQEVIALRHGACFIPEILATYRWIDTGFAAVTTGNFELSLGISRQMSSLMRSTYCHAFPAQYIAVRERRVLYEIGVTTWRPIRSNQLKWLKDLEVSGWPSGSASRLDALFLRGLNLSIRLQGLAVRLYLFLRFRPMSFGRWLARETRTIWRWLTRVIAGYHDR
jgi:glycosyltransferase involved in cell wall biosynthesis